MSTLVNRALGRSSRVLGIVPSSTHVCRSCRQQLQHQRPNADGPRGHPRTFSSTPQAFKKAGKVNRNQAKTDSSPPVNEAASSTAVDEAFDLSELETKLLKSVEWLAHQLSTLRAGGRLNPEKIERLKVQPDKSSKNTVQLGDLAQVVPQGRFIKIIATEEDHVKPILSAIQGSDLNLTPQGPTSEAPTTLTLTIPPPTGESRQQALDQAQKWSEEALHRVREARGAHQKKLRGFQVAKSVRPDDLQKATKKMEDVTKNGNEEIKKVLEGAKRVLSG